MNKKEILEKYKDFVCCEGSKYTLVDKYEIKMLSEDINKIPTFTQGSIPTILLVCNNCGKIHHFVGKFNKLTK